METFKVVGVPEHFNYIWHYAKEQGYFSRAGLDIHWEDNKSGTGAIAAMLNRGETDLAVLLTEGIIANIAEGGNSRIIQVFVKSPLVWGIHVAAGSPVQHMFGIKGKRFAISRFGSGSHIMAYVLADHLGYTPDQKDFVVVNDLDGAGKALREGEADVFLWEKYMTMPFVDAGIMKRIGEIPTPWPGFVIAAGETAIQNKEMELRKLMEVIRTAAGDFMTHPDNFEQIAKRYHLKKDKMYEWFQITEWETTETIHADMIYTTAQILQRVGLIGEVKRPEHFCAPWCRVG